MASEPRPSNTDVKSNRARGHAQQALLRLSAWGGAAAVALIAVAFAAQTETGNRRLQMALVGTSAPESAAKAAAAERRADQAQAEVRSLAAEVRKLAADRERLDNRLAGIERDFEDLTGTITRQGGQTHAASLTPALPLNLPGGLAALAPWPDLKEPTKTPPATQTTATAPATDLSEPHPVPTIAVKRPQKTEASPPATPKMPVFAKTTAAPVATEAPPAPQAEPEKVVTIAAAPTVGERPKLGAAPESITVASLPSAKAQPETSALADVPLPPERVAALPPKPAPTKPVYGIDIGGASSKAVLKARWSAVKANFGPQVAELHPIVAHDRRAGHLPYRLVIGPLPSSAAAVALCARFGLTRGLCHSAHFAGEPLAQR